MEYLVLARRYRPQTFDELVGQDHVARTLTNAITQERLAHAYLFTGPRGVGKTSTARILAKSLNCEKGPTTTPCGACGYCADIAAGRSLDVVEIDGASNRGIDEIRDLRENARYAASPGKKRIYIVDEVHMLTNEAWNALLKILEEPPPHVLFVFATTQPSKVLPTILSRCQRFDFRRIPTEAIVGRLREIGEKEGFALGDEVYYLIARRADGGLRDAESLLDQVISFAGKGASRAQAEEVLGVVGSELYFELARAIAEKNAAAAAASLATSIDGGADIVEIATGMLDHLRSLFIAAAGESPGEILDASPEMVSRLREQAKAFAGADLLRLARILAAAEREMRRSAHPRVLLELAFFEMVALDASVDLGDLLSRLDAAGVRAPGGSAAPRVRPAASAPASAVAPAGAPAASASAPTPRSAPGAARDATPPPRAAATAPQPLAAAVASPAPRASLTIDLVRARWREFLEAVGGAKRSLAAFLEHGTPLELDRGIIVVGFPESDAFQREQIEHAEHRALVERTLEKVLGERVAVKTRIVRGADARAASGAEGAPASTGSTASPAPDASREARAAVAARTQALLDNPGVRRAMQFFDAEVVSRGNAPRAARAGADASAGATPLTGSSPQSADAAEKETPPASDNEGEPE